MQAKVVATSARTLIRCFVASALLIAPVVALAQGQYDHWTLIEKSMRELDGLAKIKSATPQQIRTLADNLTKRGQVYLDLYELQRVVARDHARMLDSSAKAGSSQYAAAPYFLGRALQELGDVAGATAAYRRAATAAPATLRPLANEWLSALSGSGSQWQNGVLAWRAGKPVARATCPAGNMQCALFQAIVANDILAMARLQREMSNSPKADFSETIAIKESAPARGAAPATAPKPSSTYVLEYFDPLTLQLLGAADFAMAAEILEGKSEYAAYRGTALLRSNQFKAAEAELKPIATSKGAAAAALLAPLLGEAMYRQGNKSGAEQIWRTATGSGLNVLADVKSSLGLDSAAVVNQFAAEKRADLDKNDNGPLYGLNLARALLRFNLLRESEELLNAVRLPSRGTSARVVAPGDLAVIAQSEYRLGRLSNYRDRFVFARTDLQGVAELSPIVSKLLNQMQQVTVVMEGAEGNRGI